MLYDRTDSAKKKRRKLFKKKKPSYKKDKSNLSRGVKRSGRMCQAKHPNPSMNPKATLSTRIVIRQGGVVRGHVAYELPSSKPSANDNAGRWYKRLHLQTLARIYTVVKRGEGMQLYLAISKSYGRPPGDKYCMGSTADQPTLCRCPFQAP